MRKPHIPEIKNHCIVNISSTSANGSASTKHQSHITICEVARIYLILCYELCVRHTHTHTKIPFSCFEYYTFAAYRNAFAIYRSNADPMFSNHNRTTAIACSLKLRTRELKLKNHPPGIQAAQSWGSLFRLSSALVLITIFTQIAMH